MEIRRGTLRAFDAGTYKARVELPGSPDRHATDIPVSRGIASAELTAGRTVAVLFFDPLNPADAMVVGVTA